MVYQKVNHYYHGTSFICFSFPVGKNHDVLNNTLFTKFSRQIQFLSLKKQKQNARGASTELSNTFDLLTLYIIQNASPFNIWFIQSYLQ